MEEINLFDLSNAQLKDRLRAEGIEYKENATKRELVALLTSGPSEKTVEDVVAEENAVAAESTLSMDSVEESVSPDSSITGEYGVGSDGAALSVDEHVAVDAKIEVEVSSQLAVDKAATLHGHIEDLVTKFN